MDAGFHTHTHSQRRTTIMLGIYNIYTYCICMYWNDVKFCLALMDLKFIDSPQVLMPKYNIYTGLYWSDAGCIAPEKGRRDVMCSCSEAWNTLLALQRFVCVCV